MPKHTKTWVLTTSQDFGPKGALQLGQLLTDPWNPNSAVISRSLAPISLDTLRDNQVHEDIDFSSLSNSQVSFRTWLRSRNELIPAEGEFGSARTNAAWQRFQSKRVIVYMFPPDDAYATAAVKLGRNEHRAQIAHWALFKTLYLVTGLRILADGTSVDQWSAEAASHHAELSGDAMPAQVPLDGGLELQGRHGTAQAQTVGEAATFVYAYRIHAVTKWRGSEAGLVGDWAKGEVYSRPSLGDGEGASDLTLLDIRPSEMESRTGAIAHEAADETPSANGAGDEALPGEEEAPHELAMVARAPFKGDRSDKEELLVD